MCWQSLRTAVKAASSLLEGLTSRAQRNPAPEQSICNDNTSPAHKRPKQLHGLQGRKAEEAAETIVAVLSLLADVALLRVPGWTTAEDAKLPREVRTEGMEGCGMLARFG